MVENSAPTGVTPHTPTSTFGELEALSRLIDRRDAALISDEEFQRERGAILARAAAAQPSAVNEPTTASNMQVLQDFINRDPKHIILFGILLGSSEQCSARRSSAPLVTS